MLTIYNLRVKIISLSFKIKAVATVLYFQLILEDKQSPADTQKAIFKNGILQDNVTLTYELKQKHPFKRAFIAIREEGQDIELGRVILNSQQFRNTKLFKISLEKCFDSGAFLEAFLFMIPVRMVTEQQDQDTVQIESAKIEVSETEQSSVDIDWESDSQKEVQVSSLVSLNKILQEANQKLEIENETLKKTISRYQDKENQKKQLQMLIDGLKRKLQHQSKDLQLKNQQITYFKKQCQELTKKILRFETMSPIQTIRKSAAEQKLNPSFQKLTPVKPDLFLKPFKMGRKLADNRQKSQQTSDTLIDFTFYGLQ